ncbi:Unknown protein [Striga hermonthica]|uniref:Uncharacterized protein n=1 Tax=Striga hermonthica TaxID=68872 RepID=A0A9N7MRU0_STRHE|nr:Unknown protein [Striga hermonthica]
MMGKSGFSLTESGALDVRDDVWKEYLKIDPNAKPMRYKLWPFYADWCDIFGNDMATETNNNTSPPEVHTHEESNLHVGECSVSGREKRSRKKKKVVEEDNQFVETLSSFCKETAKYRSDIVVRVGHAHDATERRGKVYDVLKGMPNLTMGERLLTTKYLCNKNEDLDMFFSLDDEARVKMVQMIIEIRDLEGSSLDLQISGFMFIDGIVLGHVIVVNLEIPTLRRYNVAW